MNEVLGDRLGKDLSVPDARTDPDVPPGIDLTRPSAARVYDYLLGGTTNWAIDREFGARFIAKLPLIRDIARANRQFLNRVVRHLTNSGVRQFIDIGAGVPTAGNTHQVADQIAPDTRVVYVDNEPVAVAHAEILLDREGDPDRHAIVNADLREPDDVWQQAFATGILSPDEPIALLLIAVLHFFHEGPDGNDIGAECTDRFRKLLSLGSYLAVSHLTNDGIPAEVDAQSTALKQMYESSVNSRLILRSRSEIDALFGDFEMVDPGTVWVPEWHPEDAGPAAPNISFPTPSHSVGWAGVGRKVAR
jgi:hypothetical protein